MGGTLYVIATPIGNLGDITVRALEILKTVDVIACEDTRQTAKLLQRYDLHTPLRRLDDHTERAQAPKLVEWMAQGASIALVSDSGTPLISDPGWLLVRHAIDAGVTVVPIPGPSAMLSALVVSGLPTDRFVFEGFLPVKSGARKKRLEALREGGRTAVLYESPHRVVKTLEAIREVFGDAQMSVSRELTKQFEETRRGSASELLEHFTAHPPRGEFVLVLPPVERTGP
ncbi:MAG: 16S rRNA (cytidine(1402)-2'-O)-methyltransferase [Candidatus Omnitrophica bacterium CG11_big_fil_rev_8_21_14_0_20_63_9]|nr:MAG: 16S rRNA (cytidine(1402)-2'-O)-methyltransferase [Candidatus Omnitrophica bacterium CG11_big_fil_rev_8_21_14_0_20_63_9]